MPLKAHVAFAHIGDAIRKYGSCEVFDVSADELHHLASFLRPVERVTNFRQPINQVQSRARRISALREVRHCFIAFVRWSSAADSYSFAHSLLNSSYMAIESMLPNVRTLLRVTLRKMMRTVKKMNFLLVDHRKFHGQQCTLPMNY